MTSNNSSTKTQQATKTPANQNNEKGRSLLMHSSRSYWWLAVICTVVYGFAGPVFTLLWLDSVRRPSRANYLASGTEEQLYQEQLRRVADWLCGEAFVPLYLAAVVLAAVVGCVVFFYLQQKRQINFYHSQPVSRTRLFINQYAVGLLVNVVPLLLMLALSALLITAYGLGAAINPLGMIQHSAYLILFILASYSIAVLAGQLAGTMMTQMALNAVLHFAVPLAAVVITMLESVFFATYTDAMDLLEPALKFSPFCAAVAYLSDLFHGTTDVMVVTTMAGSMVAVQILIIAVCTGLAWFLYQKRPSEATGKALIYPVTEPLLKAYLMFVIALGAGFIFLTVGNKFFFYFAVIVFAVLTHMTCEVIIQHDFKAMVRRMPQCAVILVLILAIVGVFRFDLFGYDSYLPAPEKVERVALVVDETEPNNYWTSLSDVYSQDAAVKQSVRDIIEPVVYERAFNSSRFTNQENTAGYDEVLTNVRVRYELTNGKIVERRYGGVPYNILAENYENLYNLSAYRDSYYRYILQLLPEWINDMSVDGTSIFIRSGEDTRAMTEKAGLTTVTTINVMKLDISTNNTEDFAKAERILRAYQQDLHDRSYETLTQIHQHVITISAPNKDLRNSSRYLDLPVFAADKRTMAVLEEMGIQPEETYTQYQHAYVFSCKDARELEKFYREQWELATADGRELSTEGILRLFADKAQLVTAIDGTEQVSAFIQQTRLKTTGSIVTAYDDTHFVLLQEKIQGKYSDIPSGENWEFQRVYANTLPEQYQ